MPNRELTYSDGAAFSGQLQDLERRFQGYHRPQGIRYFTL